MLPISLEAILWQWLPIDQLLAAPTASLLDHGLHVTCLTMLICVAWGDIINSISETGVFVLLTHQDRSHTRCNLYPYITYNHIEKHEVPNHNWNFESLLTNHHFLFSILQRETLIENGIIWYQLFIAGNHQSKVTSHKRIFWHIFRAGAGIKNQVQVGYWPHRVSNKVQLLVKLGAVQRKTLAENTCIIGKVAIFHSRTLFQPFYNLTSFKSYPP